METTFIIIGVYILSGTLGVWVNVIFANFGDGSPFPSGKLWTWAKSHNRLSKDAKIFLAIMFCLLWLPLLIINILASIWLFLLCSFRGITNIIWVISTDMISKKTHIEAKEFDNWRENIESFIESIPSNREERT